MIDTLKASQQLKENGFDDRQAQSIINVVVNNNEQLATKSDTRELKSDIKELKSSIASIKWMIGFSITLNIAVLIAFVFR